MKTLIKNIKQVGTPIKDTPAVLRNGKPKIVSIDDIDFSPLNYRMFYSEKDLNGFAKEIGQHGIIAPLRVRIVVPGRYELVVGERRLRAARIAGLVEIPVLVQQLTDAQVREIQLAENLQREDPHPLRTAHQIGQMQEGGLKMDEIAKRLGKSKSFVLLHIKLLSLSDDFKEMFVGGKMNQWTAAEIASLSMEAQMDFFEKHCKNWKTRNFQLGSIRYIIARYRCDLARAPFDTAEEELIPETKACTLCPFNSATLKLLFPDLAKEAVCSNTTCFEQKCAASFSKKLQMELEKELPTALVFDGEPDSFIEEAIAGLPAAASLKTYNKYDITVIRPPQPPQQDEYMYHDDEEENQAAFELAMEEYNTDLMEYELWMVSDEAQKGLLLNERELKSIHFIEGRKSQAYNFQSAEVTASQVQDAIKSGTATPELLQAGIDRINKREKRNQELDRENVQLIVYDEFTGFIGEADRKCIPTMEDELAARLLVYQSLSYSARYEVDESLQLSDRDDPQQFHEKLANLSAEAYSFMIRTALASKPEAKVPTHSTGYFLCKNAGAAGIDIASIELQQKEKAEKRLERQRSNIESLENMIKKLQEQS